MKIPIEKEKSVPKRGIAWTSVQPFVENSRAVLIHRPRHVTLHKIDSSRWKPHLAVHMWCGSSQTGTKKFTFLDAPPEGKLVCWKCEENAVHKGLPASEALTGSHVHIGGVVAVRLCCETGDDKK